MTECEFFLKKMQKSTANVRPGLCGKPFVLRSRVPKPPSDLLLITHPSTSLPLSFTKSQIFGFFFSSEHCRRGKIAINFSIYCQFLPKTHFSAQQCQRRRWRAVTTTIGEITKSMKLVRRTEKSNYCARKLKFP